MRSAIGAVAQVLGLKLLHAGKHGGGDVFKHGGDYSAGKKKAPLNLNGLDEELARGWAMTRQRHYPRTIPYGCLGCSSSCFIQLARNRTASKKAGPAINSIQVILIAGVSGRVNVHATYINPATP